MSFKTSEDAEPYKAGVGLLGPEPFWILAAEVPQYHDWVKQGGLENFAKRYGFDASFVKRMNKIPAKIMFEYRQELAKIPEVHQHIIAIRTAWEQSCHPVTNSHEVMRVVEGWSEDEDGQEETVSQKARTTQE
jgi:hypothetical protein